MTSPVAFVTDSTCNLPTDLVERYGITVVPVYVIFGDQSYRDGEEITTEAFYRQLMAYKERTGQMPTTSQPSPADFQAAYERLAAKGVKEIVSVHVSAKASGTCQSAQMAADALPNVRVHVVDSGTTSMQMGFMLLEAIQAVEAGGGSAAALAAIERVKAHSSLYFAVTRVEHLEASGRTAGADKVAQAAVQVRPVVGLIDGVPQVVATERTNKGALRRVLTLTQKAMGGAKPVRLAIVHANIADQAREFAQEAAATLGFDGTPYVVDFGPALTVHFGPGLLGVAAQWS